MHTTISLRDIVCSCGSLKIKILKAADLLLGGLAARILPTRKAATNGISSPTRILIIRPGGIGDAVFLLPILKSLREMHPKIVIDILGEQRNAEVFTSQPALVNHVYCYNTIQELWTALRTPHDLVIDTEQWHYLSALSGYVAKTPLTIGFGTRPLRKKLFHIPMPYNENGHESDNFRTLFASLLKDAPARFLLAGSFTVPEDACRWATQQIPLDSVVIALGASVRERRLTSHQIVELSRAILAKSLCPVLIGGDDVRHEALAVTREIDHPRIFNFVGTTSLIQSAALIQRSRFYIGPDSGFMHIAAAVGTKVIAIFGPGHLEKWFPREDGHTVITRKLPCSPCTKFSYSLPTCHGTRDCIIKITINDILKDMTP